ncbi:MAG TPA: subclass B3 metallo-beta-lactamase, partial [Gemmatimonadaceae bacterium]
AAPSARAQLPKAWDAWNVPVKPFRVIDNIYYVGATEVSSFLITSPQGDILLDGGTPATAPEILANITSLGFNPRDVKILINSHAHADHAGGLAELKRATGAEFVASVQDSALLANGGHNDFAFGNTLLFPPIIADRTFHDGETVHVGTSTLVAHITPGHTRGCTTWTTTATEGGVKRSVVFTCSYSAPDYQLVNNAAYPNIIADYRKTFGILHTLPCDVLLAPHGSQFKLLDKMKRAGETPNPFVSAAECKAYFDASEKAIEAKISEQQAKAKKP